MSTEIRRDLTDRIGLLAQAFIGGGHRFYLVGGLVREVLLGEDLSGDIDITTDAVPDRIAELAADWADVIWDQGRAFGTIGARRGDTIVEITTHRADSYDRGSRKPHVRFSDDITTDLSRRDFTVNAIAIQLPDWVVLDPFAGREDLAARRLRTPSAPDGLFSDDPLRMLRAARFCARLALEADPAVVAAVKRNRPRLAIVSRERIAAELTKLLEVPRPSAGIEFLASTGLLEDLLRNQSDNPGAIVPAAALDAVAADVGLRWAILLGPKFADDSQAAACLAALRIGASTIADVKSVLRAASAIDAAFRDIDPPLWRSAVRRLAIDHGAVLERASAALAAWNRAVPPQFAALILEVDRIEGDALRRLPLDGHEVMALLAVSGPAVGEALAWLREQQIQRGPLDKAEARDLIAEWVPRQPH